MDDYALYIGDASGVSMDITELVVSLDWRGSIRQLARELSGTLAVPRDKTPPPLYEGTHLILYGNGAPIFTGPLTHVTVDSNTSITDISCIDRGWYLTQNEGSYQFRGAPPREVAKAICADANIPAGDLADAPGSITKNFIGVALDQILYTAYSGRGSLYLPRFTGSGALEVVEKDTKAGIQISSTMMVTNSWSIEKLQNSVAIVDDGGAVLDRVEDTASISLNGRLQHVMKDGDSARDEATAWLLSHAMEQKVSVETLGDIRLITGAAVELRDTGAGVSGLFWIDSDTHTWKNGQHFTKLDLNFRNIMNEQDAGGDL